MVFQKPYHTPSQNHKNQPNLVLYLVWRSKIFVSVATLGVGTVNRIENNVFTDSIFLISQRGRKNCNSRLPNYSNQHNSTQVSVCEPACMKNEAEQRANRRQHFEFRFGFAARSIQILISGSVHSVICVEQSPERERIPGRFHAGIVGKICLEIGVISPLLGCNSYFIICFIN